MKKIYFATGNKGKAAEAEFILGRDIEIADLDLEEIQSEKVEDIVSHKLGSAFSKLKSPVIVDDVSLELDAWGGFPGPFVKFLHGKDTQRILYMLRHEENRMGTLIATIGYHDSQYVHFFIGKIRVEIAKENMGDRGWGLDPILIPEGSKLTFAQMTDELKNSLSHRRKAFDKFKTFLDSQK